MARFSLLRLTLIYLRVGNLTFGGGDPTMAGLQSELVASRGWITPETYGLVYALARITPGTNVLAFCAGTAYELAGWLGAALAVAAASLPAAVVVVALTAAYETLKTHPRAMAAIAGTLAAAVGMMGTSAWQLLAPQMRAGRWPRALVIGGGSLALAWGLGWSPIPVLGLAALAGFCWQVPERK